MQIITRRRSFSIYRFFFVSVLVFLLGSEICFGEKSIKQRTSGDQSPVVYADGNVTITYNQLDKIIEILEKWRIDIEKDFSEHASSLEKESEELRKRLTSIKTNEYQNINTKEPETWAAKILLTLPLLKDELLEKERKIRESSERRRVLIPILFERVLKDIDTKISALQKQIPGIEVESYNTFLIFKIEGNTEQKHIDLARKISFPNGRIIQVNISPGSIRNGLVANFPEMNLVQLHKKQDLIEAYFHLSGYSPTFGGSGFIPNIYYINYIDHKNIPDFDKAFSNSFGKLIQAVMSRAD